MEKQDQQLAKYELHEKTQLKNESVCKWFREKSASVAVPIYSSYDIRDAGYKIGIVDANIYPAGFNNICHIDKENSVGLMDRYLTQHYQHKIQNILLVTEEHTKNSFYWENVWTIKDIIENTGRKVRLSFPKKLIEPLIVTSVTGKELLVESGAQEDIEKEFQADLIVNNNDFSDSFEGWAKEIAIPMNPPRELGWYQRKKSRYFKYYNQLVEEFSSIVGVDPILLNVETELFEGFEIESEVSRKNLADRVDRMIHFLENRNSHMGIQEKPFVFVKNNSGTYGLAVIKVGSAQEIVDWSYKARKKMKAAKGGKTVNDVIIQEGIPSIVQAEGAVAEPVIYMIGCSLAGGFLRSHGEKSSTESLNSPGAVYKRLCVSDLEIKLSGCIHENVYGWIAKIALLAIAYEAQEMGVEFRRYS